MTLRIPAKVLIHVWSYDFYDMTLSTGKQQRHMIKIEPQQKYRLGTISNIKLLGGRGGLYPPDLQLNKANITDIEAPFLELHLSVANEFVSSKVYKRDDFDFDIVHFPFLYGDVRRRASYCVYISLCGLQRAK